MRYVVEAVTLINYMYQCRRAPGDENTLWTEDRG